jgi:hypothetical protein
MMIHLEDMPPILSLVVQPFIKHLHNLNKILPFARFRPRVSPASLNTTFQTDSLIISQLSNLVHLCTTRTPWIIRRSISHFCLRIRVSL